LTFEAPAALLLQMNVWEMVQHNGPAGMVVLVILFGFSIFSWTVIFSKWQAFRGARQANARFLRAFRKASGMEAVMIASEQFGPRRWWRFSISVMRKSSARSRRAAR